MSLAAILEEAASALPAYADAIRPANGDPFQLLKGLGPDGAASVLTWLLLHAPDSAGELANDWAEEPVGVQALTGLDEEALPKPARKLLRRVRHRLRSQGITLGGEEIVPEAHIARLPDIADHVEVAYVSALDPRGARMVYLVEANPAGGARLFEAVVDDARGIVDFQVYSSGRARVRTFLKTMTAKSQFAVVETSPDSVRALLHRALQAHPADRALPQPVREWRSHFGGPSRDGAKTPGQEAGEALDGEAAPADLDELEGAIRGNRIGPWPPSPQRLQDLGELVKEQAEGQIIVSGARASERLEDALALATADLFDSGYSQKTANRLEESAYVAWKCGREAEARGCLAAARSFREAEVRENRIARVLLEVSLEPVLKAMQEASESPEDEGLASSLIKT